MVLDKIILMNWLENKGKIVVKDKAGMGAISNKDIVKEVMLNDLDRVIEYTKEQIIVLLKNDEKITLESWM